VESISAVALPRDEMRQPGSAPGLLAPWHAGTEVGLRSDVMLERLLPHKLSLERFCCGPTGAATASFINHAGVS
jgi:hypothetical protein